LQVQSRFVAFVVVASGIYESLLKRCISSLPSLYIYPHVVAFFVLPSPALSVKPKFLFLSNFCHISLIY